MTHCSIEPKTIKKVKGYGFLSFVRNLFNKYGKHLLHTAAKTGLDPLKTASKKLVHKTAETTGKSLRNKIDDKIANQKPLTEANSRDIEEIVTPSEKKEETLNELRQVL